MGLPFDKEMSSKSPTNSTLDTIRPRSSITIINKDGERGLPYLRPLLPLKKPLGEPFTNIEKEKRRKENLHPISPLDPGSHLPQNPIKESPVHMIICFFHIDLTNDSGNVSLQHCINALISHKRTIHYLPPQNKSILRFQNHHLHD